LEHWEKELCEQEMTYIVHLNCIKDCSKKAIVWDIHTAICISNP
jgi:hypothetical protein